MSTSQLYIPDKIKVGFQVREGTYTGKLAYVIYYDMKGVLRKEKSWQSWRHDKIEPLDFTNEPTEGFVLNKGVGGKRGSSGYDVRNEYIRVYDPRDFEFEISVANLLFILRECDCSRGKGLEGKFVYAWDKTELVLLPERAQEYQQSKHFTGIQHSKIKAKDLIPGAVYLTKKQEPLTYVGKYDVHAIEHDKANDRNSYYYENVPAVVKKFVFWNGQQLVYRKDIAALAAVSNPEPVANLGKLIQRHYKSEHGSKVVEVFLKDALEQEEHVRYLSCNYADDKPGVYIQTSHEKNYGYGSRESNDFDYMTFVCVHTFKDGKLSVAYTNDRRDRVRYGSGWNYQRQEQITSLPAPSYKQLFARLESGIVCRVSAELLMKVKEPDNGDESQADQ